MLTPSYFSLSHFHSLYLYQPWRSLCDQVKFPLLQISSHWRALLDPQLSIAKTLFLSNAPAILRRWPWTPISTPSCSERIRRGARTIIGKGLVSRKKVLSSCTASKLVESHWQRRNYIVVNKNAKPIINYSICKCLQIDKLK